MDICGACAGACCSFRTMGISFCDIPDGTTLETLLYDRRHDLTQLLRSDGTLPDMRFYDARSKTSGQRHLLFDCQHVQDGRCAIYEDRPSMCRVFQCEALQGTLKLGVMLRRYPPMSFGRLRDVTVQVQAALREVAVPAFRKQQQKP